MGFFTSLETSSSALTAHRLVMDVISNNIANAQTTRTPQGGVFRRSRVVLQPRSPMPPTNQGKDAIFSLKKTGTGVGAGVRAVRIEQDFTTPTKWVKDPSHPDALKTGPQQGWVELPNVELVQEMTDMIVASKAYEANLSIIENTKTLFQQTLEVLKGV